MLIFLFTLLFNGAPNSSKEERLLKETLISLGKSTKQLDKSTKQNASIEITLKKIAEKTYGKISANNKNIGRTLKKIADSMQELVELNKGFKDYLEFKEFREFEKSYDK